MTKANTDPSPLEVSPLPNRAEGELVARFTRSGHRTRVERVYEAGGLRLRFPKVVPGLMPDCEAVCVNTGGGMVGGDSARLAFSCGPGANVTFTTQSAEKIYRAKNAATTIDVSLNLDAGARAEWLPQETILFDRIHLRRRLDADISGDASLLIVESLVFGRLAMGESVRSGELYDRWRIRRAGRLIFAEDLRIAGDIAAILDRPALGGGARATATVLLVAPEAELLLESVRAALSVSAADWGASAWNGMLTVRALSRSPDRVRATIVAVLKALRGQAAPRVWQ